MDNTENIERRKQGKRSEFWDNCGARTNGASPTYTFIMRDNKAVTLHHRKELYCVEKMRNKIYEPLESQTNSNDLFVLKKLFNSLSRSEKGPNQFRRRCTWVVNAPSSLPRLDLNVALVEYVGRYPADKKPHGNSTKHQEPYRRTNPKVYRKLQDQMKTIGIKDLKLTINRKTKDDVSKHWNEKQLRNITYRLTKESDPTPFSAADQIVHVEELVKRIR